MARSRRQGQETRRGRQRANKPSRALQRPRSRALCRRVPHRPSPGARKSGGRLPSGTEGWEAREGEEGTSFPNRRAPRFAFRGDRRQQPTRRRREERREQRGGAGGTEGLGVSRPRASAPRRIGESEPRAEDLGRGGVHNHHRGAKRGSNFRSRGGGAAGAHRAPASARLALARAGSTDPPRPLGLQVRLRLLFCRVAVISHKMPIRTAAVATRLSPCFATN